jgi:hypothetical protein
MRGKLNDSWSNPVKSAIDSPLAGLLIYGLLAVLLVAILLLPPISLAERLLSMDYVRIPSQEGGYVTAGDSAQVFIPPAGVQGRTRIKFSAIPRSSFLEGSAGSDLLEAAENIPPWLIMQSPYYRIQFRGQEPPDQVMVRVPIPAGVEPLGTLDLYGWNGEAWEWLPHLIPPEENYAEAELDFLPQSVVVMQTRPLQPMASADLAPGAEVPAQLQDSLAEINPHRLYLDAAGAIRGDPGALPRPGPATPYRIVPTLRNWEAGAPPRSDLIDNILIDKALREGHVQRIVELVERSGYPGIDVDYRGINPDLRAEYTAFITRLADALHERDKQLSVRLELPTQVAQDRWETGAYDWRAIGAVADTVKIPALRDPNAYTPGGQMDAMLQWAVGEVNRYELQMLIPTYSIERVDGDWQEVSAGEALAPFSQVTVEGGSTAVNPGQVMSFNLSISQPSTGIQFDSQSGLYWFAYAGQDGRQRTVWLETSASIARKLGYVAGYHLRGVAVQHVLDEESGGRTWQVIQDFLNLILPPAEGRFEVVWHVESASGKLVAEESTGLTAPRFQWTAPQEAGQYRVRAIMSPDGGATGSVQGSVIVTVSASSN